jgi:hypothetical protein
VEIVEDDLTARLDVPLLETLPELLDLHSESPN